MKKTLTLPQIIQHLPSLSTANLHTILDAINKELPKRSGQLAGYTDFIEDFCDDNELLNNVWKECEDLNLSPGSKTNSVATQWISPSDNPYIFNDTNMIHSAKDIKNFPSIYKLISMVNESTAVTGPLDSCLVTKYNSNKAHLRLHSDDEKNQIDQDKSICSFSLGCERSIEFWSKSRKPKCVKSYRMKNNSLVIMRPGCQQNLKHCVRPDPKRKSSLSDQTPSSQVRYSLSFRSVARPTSDFHKVNAQQSIPETRLSKPKGEITAELIPTCTHTNLVAGDSYAARLKSDLLGKGKIHVDNIASGGAKIDKVKKSLLDYREANPDRTVDKIIISVGTNDIRNAKDGINHLRGPLKSLCSTIDENFPNSKVFFQSLLPLPLKHSRDWEANRWVMAFNKIIFSECRFRNFYFIDAFFPFCNFKKKLNEPYSRYDPLFEKDGIHPSNEKGLGILARKYIFVLHKFGKHFNPLIFQ